MIMNRNNALELYNLVLNVRQIADIELLLNGGFNPVNQFLSKKDYESVKPILDDCIDKYLGKTKWNLILRKKVILQKPWV